MHLLFWLSLIPWITAWMGQHPRQRVPVVVYGIVLFASGAAYLVLSRALLRLHSPTSRLAIALGADWKGKLSAVAFLVALPLAAVTTWAAIAVYISVSIVWIVPDRRISRVLAQVPAATGD
jgi:uncharacterized membrane protein